MTILSVDLAYKRWRDLGIALLTKRDQAIDVVFVHPPDAPLDPESLATYLDDLCAAYRVRLLLLDGPQAWKDEGNGFEHARVCERRLNTPAKTGLPGHVKPGAYGPFVRFSITVYDALKDRGWTRLDRCEAWDSGRKTVVESFPLSAWKSLGMEALGSKAKTKAGDVASKLKALKELFALNVVERPTHDELQAVVAGLAGISMEAGAIDICDVCGVAPFERDGTWREGFIVNPTAPRRMAATLLPVVAGCTSVPKQKAGTPHGVPAREESMTDVKFVLGVDLDGVVADFYGGLRPIAAEWLDIPLEKLATTVTYGLPEWKVNEAPGGYEALHKFAVTQRDLFRQLKPIPGAPAALRALSAADVRIRIITHRLFIKHFHQDAIRQTVEWLDYHDIPYWDLCFMRDKAAVGAELYIEDTPSNVVKLREDGHNTIVFTNSTNLQVPPPRANDWSEAVRLILEEQRAWLERIDTKDKALPGE